MSLKKVAQVKCDKGFRIWDILIYAVILVIAAILFIVVFATRDTSPLEGVRVYSRGELVFEYVFENDEYKILSKNVKFDISDSGEALTVKVTADIGYNVIEIQKSGYVCITQADCRTKDCINIQEIKDNSGSIICTPHGLRVVPFNYDDDDGVVIV